MAHEEMTKVCDLDVELVMDQKHRIWLYFAESDGWVGESREKIVKALDYEAGSLRVAYGEADIPHAFCISASSHLNSVQDLLKTTTDHSVQVANQCLSWMSSLVGSL
jgi:Lipid-droplet associated hydrolase